MESTQTSLDKLMAILFAHDEPDILGDEVKVLVQAVSVNKKMLKRYIDLARDIRYAWQKVGKYPNYFDRFYPSSEVISETECLTHHVHAYLDDLYTVRQKLFTLLDALKNDAKKSVSNAEELKASLDELKKKVSAGFADLDKYRGQHRHAGMRFFHEELLKAENAETQIAQLNGPFFGSMFDPEKKKKILEKLNLEREQSFLEAKNYWIKTAKQNSDHLDENLDRLFDGLGQIIYQLLGIQTTAQELLKLSDYAREKKHD